VGDDARTVEEDGGERAEREARSSSEAVATHVLLWVRPSAKKDEEELEGGESVERALMKSSEVGAKSVEEGCEVLEGGEKASRRSCEEEAAAEVVEDIGTERVDKVWRSSSEARAMRGAVESSLVTRVSTGAIDLMDSTAGCVASSSSSLKAVHLCWDTGTP